MKKSKFSSNIGVLCSLLVFQFCCISCNAQNATADKNIKYDIQKQWNTFIDHWENENTEHLMSLFADDAVLVIPDSNPKEGKVEIAEFYNFLFSNNKSSVYNYEMRKFTHSGSIVSDYGAFDVKWTPNEGEEWTYYARSVTQWELSGSGEWEISLILFNNPAEE